MCGLLTVRAYALYCVYNCYGILRWTSRFTCECVTYYMCHASYSKSKSRVRAEESCVMSHAMLPRCRKVPVKPDALGAERWHRTALVAPVSAVCVPHAVRTKCWTTRTLRSKLARPIESIYFLLENKHKDPFLCNYIVTSAIFREELADASDWFRSRHGARGRRVGVPWSKLYKSKKKQKQIYSRNTKILFSIL